MNKCLHWAKKNQIVVILFFLLFSRLPFLMNPNLILDTDECIVGLMAKHFAEGKEVPIYFYGQGYGFSFLEVCFIRLFNLVFGNFDWSIKLAMLSFWAIGILFFYKSIKLFVSKNEWLPFWISLYLITCSTWIIWSMKARGGYVTAFTLSMILVYMCLQVKQMQKLFLIVLQACLLLIVFEAQPLWIAGLIPFLLYFLYNSSPKHIVIFLVSCCLFYGFVLFLKKDIHAYWNPTIISRDYWTNLKLIPRRIYYNFTGSYIYEVIIKPSMLIKMTSLFCLCFIGFVLVWGAFNMNKRINNKVVFYVSLCSVLLTTSSLLILPVLNPRYILPLMGYALIMISFFLLHTANEKFSNIGLFILVVFNLFSISYFNNYNKFEGESKKELMALINNLKQQSIHHVFCEDPTLQWKINYYSNEEVIARYTGNVDRYMPYIHQVNKQYSLAYRNVAMVGYHCNRQIPGCFFVEKYYIVNNASKNLLTTYGFELPK
jgi:hypothetical protein